MKRLDGRGRINDDRTLTFTWDGRAMSAHPGDTVASALLANGVRVLGSSVLMNRPRGVVTDTMSDPNAFGQIGTGESSEPLMRLTQVEVYEGLTAISRIHKGVLPTGTDTAAPVSTACIPRDTPSVELIATART